MCIRDSSAGALPNLEPNPKAERPRVVYFPSCASRSMGPAQGDPETDALPVKTAALLRKAGFEVILPEDRGALCCGQPFASKGLPEPVSYTHLDVYKRQVLDTMRQILRDSLARQTGLLTATPEPQ